MKLLILAPHPFYQERGTPIAVDLLLQALSRRGGEINLITFPEGENRAYPGVRLHRSLRPPFVRNIPPGFSAKKLACDVFLFFSALKQVLVDRPDVIHAVEESVFMALFFRALFRIPYVYDMDSSMADQLVEKMPGLRWLARFFRWWESRAIRHALVVVPVCGSLAALAQKNGARHIQLLTDISLLSEAPSPTATDLRGQLGAEGFCFMYVGNLERYQGIDLLIEAFELAHRRRPDLCLVIVGGSRAHIERYQRRLKDRGCAGRVRFAGPRPLSAMGQVFKAADALVSPRIQGNNTPMKIYSYLDSGRPVLATDLPTHTQAVSAETALLAPPEPAAFAEAMLRLAEDAALRERLARNARELVRRKHSRAAYEKGVNDLYDHVQEFLKK